MSVLSGSLRARVRSGVEPIARLFGRVGLTPNALTLIGFGIAVVAAWFAATEAWLIAGLLVAFGAVFDLFDGALARVTNQTSRFGAFMDSTFDRAGEAVVYIGITAGLLTVAHPNGIVRLYGAIERTGVGPLIAIAAMTAAFMVSYTRAKSEGLGFSSGSGMANVGLAPREVRIVILALALLIAGVFRIVVEANVPGEGSEYNYWWYVLVGGLALIAILATITTIQRILFVYRQSKSQEVQE